MPKHIKNLRGFTTTSSDSCGFTLVELLVVIAILAILGTLGLVQYRGINSKARDSARKADLYEVSTALEVNKTREGYVPLQISQFSSFQWIDPTGNSYCIASGNPTNPTSTQAWGITCPAGYVSAAPGVPAGVFENWKVCTYLENLTSDPSHVFCKVSIQ